MLRECLSTLQPPLVAISVILSHLFTFTMGDRAKVPYAISLYFNLQGAKSLGPVLGPSTVPSFDVRLRLRGTLPSGQLILADIVIVHYSGRQGMVECWLTDSLPPGGGGPIFGPSLKESCL